MGESFQSLRPSFMRASRRRVCSSGLTSSQYLSRMIPESTIDLLDRRNDAQKALHVGFIAETQDALDARAVVPTAIEDHDLACRGQNGM